MLRLALPVLSCATLLWCGSDAPPAARARSAAPDVATEADEPPARSRPEPEAPLPSDALEPPSEPDELRQYDLRDLVARGTNVDGIARVVREATAVHVTAIVNVLEVVAPAGKHFEIEQILDDRRRSPSKRILRFYDVKDICADDPPEVGPPFEIESLIQAIEATIGIGAAEIRAKNRVLVVRADPAVHAAIAAYLVTLRWDVEIATPHQSAYVPAEDS